MMYYCRSCAASDPDTSPQCRNCTSTDPPIRIYNYGSECSLCLETKHANITVFNCGHWVCENCMCHRVARGEACMICQTTISDFIECRSIPVQWMMEPEIRPDFQKLISRVRRDPGEAIVLLNEYYKWLRLLAECPEIAPSSTIKNIWAMHVLDTVSYRSVCKCITGTDAVLDFDPATDSQELSKFSSCMSLYEKNYGPMHISVEPYWRMPNYHTTRFSQCKACIFVKSLTGATITIRFDPKMTTLDIRQLVREKEGLPIDAGTYIYHARILENDKTAESYGMSDCSTVHLCLRMRGC